MPEEQDAVDALVGQWAEQRPDLDTHVMAEVGRLVRVARLIEGRLGAYAGEYGLAVPEFDVLFTLRRAGPPFRLSPSRIADSLLVTSGTLTGRLDRLERRGLLKRVRNPEDRRGMDVELTTDALTLVDEVVEQHVANEEQMLSGLSASERKRLEALMRKLLAHLERGE